MMDQTMNGTVEKVCTDLTEIGSTGLRKFGGVLAEEFVPQGIMNTGPERETLSPPRRLRSAGVGTDTTTNCEDSPQP